LFDAFDNGVGSPLPPPDETGTRNEPIREAVLERFNANAAYRELFGNVFNHGMPFDPGGIEMHMIGQALGEFQTSLTFADAPLDRFARGEREAMSESQKRGALVFFGKGRCVQCHAVAGSANEMFSDFQNRAIGVPQIAPVFGVGTGNVVFDGPGQNEDFGAEQISGDPADRYKFRTAPLRNAAVQPAFMHNGAFTRLEDAIRHHLNVFESARAYDPVAAGVDEDLAHHRGPIEPVLERVDSILKNPIHLTNRQFDDLVAFVRDALTDSRALPENLCDLVPDEVPSGLPVATFSGCK
jgi:cytochrome c peroxidase